MQNLFNRANEHISQPFGQILQYSMTQELCQRYCLLYTQKGVNKNYFTIFAPGEV